MKKIQVLMSTYNGEKYLREQIDSIMMQDCERKGVAKLCLLIRDDGSKDSTREILAEYASRYPEQISWYQGENKGVIGSFFDLIKQSDDGADYYALADQDDYWLESKLRVGIEALEALPSGKKPCLYCCKTKPVDEKLRELKSQIKRPAMRPGFANALVENIVPGCTTVMNSVLRNMVKKNSPKYTVMHDWWLYLVASCFGRVVYDEASYIYYRQHGGNQVGSSLSKWRELVDRIQQFQKKRRMVSYQLEEFVRIYGENKSSRLVLAQELLASRKSFRRRWKLVRSGIIYRQRKNDDRIFKLILLLGGF